MKHKLILASASPRRKELLEQVGVAFEIIPATGEEVISSLSPKEAVMELSRQKAEEVAGRAWEEPVIVLGADTVVALDRQILGKPRDEKDAQRMLGLLSGRTHSVFTGVTLIAKSQGRQQLRSFYEETKVFMYPMKEQQILSYIRTGEPMDKAGAYAIQGRCALYIRGIQGDYCNVVGLPVARIFQEITESGIEIL